MLPKFGDVLTSNASVVVVALQSGICGHILVSHRQGKISSRGNMARCTCHWMSVAVPLPTLHPWQHLHTQNHKFLQNRNVHKVLQGCSLFSLLDFLHSPICMAMLCNFNAMHGSTDIQGEDRMIQVYCVLLYEAKYKQKQVGRGKAVDTSIPSQPRCFK